MLQDVESFEQTQEMLARLKTQALGNRQVEDGSVAPAAQAIRRLRGKGAARKAAA